MHPRSRVVLGSSILLLIGSSIGAPARAQQQFELTPFIGLLVPLSTLYSGGGLGETEISQSTGFALGANFAYYLSPRLALEAGLAFASGNLQADPGGEQDDNVTILSGVARYRVSRAAERTRIDLLGGVGLVRHGGDAVDDLETVGLEGFTDPGLILGAGVTFPVGTTLNVRIEARDHIFSSRLEDDQGDESDSSLQNDVVLYGGISLPFGGPLRHGSARLAAGPTGTSLEGN